MFIYDFYVNKVYQLALKIMALFWSNYVWEQLFSIKIVKINQGTRLTDTHLSFLVKVRIASIFKPSIKNLEASIEMEHLYYNQALNTKSTIFGSY